MGLDRQTTLKTGTGYRWSLRGAMVWPNLISKLVSQRLREPLIATAKTATTLLAAPRLKALRYDWKATTMTGAVAIPKVGVEARRLHL